jgi:hypothetical protein
MLQKIPLAVCSSVLLCLCRFLTCFCFHFALSLSIANFGTAITDRKILPTSQGSEDCSRQKVGSVQHPPDGGDLADFTSMISRWPKSVIRVAGSAGSQENRPPARASYRLATSPRHFLKDIDQDFLRPPSRQGRLLTHVVSVARSTLRVARDTPDAQSPASCTEGQAQHRTGMTMALIVQ